MRAGGILLPVFSLPSRYGIGCFSKEAYRFIDQLKEAGQTYWQILPLGPTGYGDSPYQTLSGYGGNPYFIDLEDLVLQGLLTLDECTSLDFGSDAGRVDYGKLHQNRGTLLRLAYSRYEKSVEYLNFLDEEKSWLEDYCLFMAVKAENQGKPWDQWEEPIKTRQPKVVAQYKKALAEEMDFYSWTQYIFYDQWFRLKDYANENGIKIIGDLPFYVAYDSADCWANTVFFQLDQNKEPTFVAGCPPDYFAETGQLWGNPLYKWPALKRNGYKWWINRIRFSCKVHDVVRIDHFRGFDTYYSIPASDETAENGVWEKGPGIKFFKYMEKALGKKPIIAEDLGDLSDSVRKLVKDTGFPGMKILEFAFSKEKWSEHRPHCYTKNSVVYTGTHDNDTVRGWFSSLPRDERELVKAYLGRQTMLDSQAAWALIVLGQQSIADTCIVPLQDYLNLDSQGRVNTPGTADSNWQWRFRRNDLTPRMLERIKRLSELCDRA